MKVLVTKIKETHGYRGDFSYIFFKCVETGKTYKTCISPEFRNFDNWKGIEVGMTITGVHLVGDGKLIDADSIPVIVEGYKKESDEDV